MNIIIPTLFSGFVSLGFLLTQFLSIILSIFPPSTSFYYGFSFNFLITQSVSFSLRSLHVLESTYKQ